MYFIFCR